MTGFVAAGAVLSMVRLLAGDNVALVVTPKLEWPLTEKVPRLAPRWSKLKPAGVARRRSQR